MNKLNMIVLTVLLMFSLIINIYWGYYFYPKWYPHSVDIPNQQQINNFCKEKGFDYGFLSSSYCKENEILCAKEIHDLIQYKCIKWEK